MKAKIKRWKEKSFLRKQLKKKKQRELFSNTMEEKYITTRCVCDILQEVFLCIGYCLMKSIQCFILVYILMLALKGLNFIEDIASNKYYDILVTMMLIVFIMKLIFEFIHEWFVFDIKHIPKNVFACYIYANEDIYDEKGNKVYEKYEIINDGNAIITSNCYLNMDKLPYGEYAVHPFGRYSCPALQQTIRKTEGEETNGKSE